MKLHWKLPKPNGYLSVSTLSLLTIASVMSLRGLPMMAAEGPSAIFYIIFATVVLLIPAALVSAELGSAYSQDGGGVFNWVSAAFGDKAGFVAVWLQWMENVAWYPAVLGFGGACLAYLFGAPHLANNGIYTGVTIILIFGAATMIATRGFDATDKISKWGVILGTVFPAILVSILALIWIISGEPVAFLDGESIKVALEHRTPVDFFPPIKGLGSIAFLAGIVLLFSGVEVEAVQVRSLQQPSKQYPKAVFIAVLVIFILFICGSMAVAIVVPAQELTSGAGLTAGLMIAFEMIFEHFHIKWMVPVMGLLLAFGVIGGVLCWVISPTRELLVTAQSGNLPPFMARANKNGSPISMLIIQFCGVAVLASLYFFMKDVSAAFYILSAMTATLYLLMYMMMFLAGIVLRYKNPTMPRPYRIGKKQKGNASMLIVAGVGFVGVAFAFLLAFIPPDNLVLGNKAFYTICVALGLLVFGGSALVLQACKKPTWKNDSQTVAVKRALLR